MVATISASRPLDVNRFHTAFFVLASGTFHSTYGKIVDHISDIMYLGPKTTKTVVKV